MVSNMSYTPYADAEYYKNEFSGTTIQDEDIEKTLKNASRHIDALTYNRIVGKGIDALTEFQVDIVKEVACEIAEFEYENAELINSILQTYSINGVSMSFGSSWNVMVQNGIAIKRDTYERLCQTGLCSRILRS